MCQYQIKICPGTVPEHIGLYQLLPFTFWECNTYCIGRGLIVFGGGSLTILGWALAVTAMVKGILFLFGYLHNQVFPQPLEEEEERSYLIKLKNGSEEARNVLIERNLRLVAHVVRKYESSGEDMEDLISIGTIGLIKAIKTFNDDRGVRLATYAAR